MGGHRLLFRDSSTQHLDFLPRRFILRFASEVARHLSFSSFLNWGLYSLRLSFQPIMAGSSSPAGKPEKTMSSTLLTMKV